MKKNSGFSLIELLVGIAIVITATTVVLSIIVSSFRISNKTTTNDNVRQNGNYAISQLTRMIQFADSFKGATNDSSFSTVDLVCSPSGGTYHFIRVTYQGVDRTMSCTNDGVFVNSISSIDRSRISIIPNSCYFTCRQDNAATSPVIGINFGLQLGTGAIAEKSARVNFSTKVKMRNL